MNLENFNYYGDSRVISAMAGDTRYCIKACKRTGKAWLNARLLDGFESSVEGEVELERVQVDGLEAVVVYAPVINMLCPTCDGDGTVVDPNIDAGGISFDEYGYDYDPDFEDDYFDGRYDITCPECKGHKVIQTLDFESIENRPDSYPMLTQMIAYMKNTEREIEREAEERARELRWGY